jgi:hypothetical protein
MPVASGPSGNKPIATIWHHAASHVMVNRTADFIARAFNLRLANQ